MSVLKKCSVAIKAVICAVIISLAMPALALADKHDGDRGHGRERNKKHVKFVNFHDARDGRWDRDDDDHGRKFRRGKKFSRKFRRNHDRDHDNWKWTFRREDRRHDRHDRHDS